MMVALPVAETTMADEARIRTVGASISVNVKARMGNECYIRARKLLRWHL